MVSLQLAQMSNTLFTVAFIAYIVAMVCYFFRLAFTRVSVEGVTASTVTGTRIGWLATGLAALGWGVHLGSVVTRGFAAGGRVPWGNMYEYASTMALLVVVVGLVVVQHRFGYGHLMGFVLAAAVLMMISALLLFAEAGPLVPALQSYWIKIHTSATMIASAIFIVGFAMTALYLVKDTAERRVAASGAYSGSTVGAGETVVRGPGTRAPSEVSEEAPVPEETLETPPAIMETPPVGGFVAEADGELEVRVASPFAQREVLSPVLFPVVPGAVVAMFTLLVWRAPIAAVIAGSVAALLGMLSWYAVPYLPPAAKLDSLAYRTITFAFPIWTFAIMAGAIWAEEAWGRYWGWDPKETGAFFTWVLYAAYLHARSTHGWRGRGAAWIGVVAFFALMVTFYVVNLFVVGLHSYAGVS
jgi:ABC-type transport system involved in cytochrome c biogenesis permease subunit